jgi:uncharacterized protein YecT (DUF1311 family)
MILLLLASLASQAPLEAEYRASHCSDPQNQSDMNICAGIDFERADAELNSAWREAIAGARAADRELDRDDERPTNEAVLRQAQRAWLSFRDAHCGWEGYEARGGSMEPMLYNGCRARITRERTAQLRREPLGR